MRIVSLLYFPLAAALLFAPVVASAHEQDGVAIIADQEAGAVRFVIDGKEVARLDASGLHVREDISYGGALTDYGTSGFVEHIAKGDAGADDEE